jgi:hypothetical protein
LKLKIIWYQYIYYLKAALMPCRFVQTRYLNDDMLEIAHTNVQRTIAGWQRKIRF